MSWEVQPLEELCEVFTDGDWIESKDQSPEGIRLVQTGNIGEGVFKDRENKARFISNATFTRLKCTEVFEGDCLVSRLPDPVGRACILPDTGKQMITGVDCSIIRFKQKVMKPVFFQYYSQSDLYLRDVAKLISGTTRDRISRKNLGSVPVPIPPLPEQQRIVGVLDAAFAALREAEGHVERNRANARELFESYLNGVFEGKGDGWVEKRLGVLIDIQNGYAFSSNEYKDEGHFLIRISNVQDGEITLAKPKYVSIDDSRLKRFILNEGDILVSLTGNIGRVGIMQAEHLPAALNQRVARITLKDEKTIRHNFLFFFLRSNFFRKHLQAAGHGAAQQNVSTKEIAEVELSVPPLAEQQRVLDALRELQIKTDDLEATYQQKLIELDGLKKGLLGAAFSGEL